MSAQSGAGRGLGDPGLDVGRSLPGSGTLRCSSDRRQAVSERIQGESAGTGRKYQSPFLPTHHFWQTFSRIINYLFALSIFLDQIFWESVIESGRWVCLIQTFRMNNDVLTLSHLSG